jgi:hypothetical protein
LNGKTFFWIWKIILIINFLVVLIMFHILKKNIF